eukprot:scaffold187870_cov15-Tisochrysis_lutea.AAC.1
MKRLDVGVSADVVELYHDAQVRGLMGKLLMGLVLMKRVDVGVGVRCRGAVLRCSGARADG